jgi:hypothetical protein
MDKVINYILESGISLALLTIVYVLFLRKETLLRQNRIFLLSSILFSVILPLIKLPALQLSGPVMLPEITVTPYKSVINIMAEYGNSVVTIQGFTLNILNVMVFIYLTGVVFFLMRFVFRIVQLSNLIEKNEVKEFSGYKIVYLNRNFSPFSFLNYVFISKLGKDDHNVKKMLMHEIEHVKQGHSIDIILL